MRRAGVASPFSSDLVTAYVTGYMGAVCDERVDGDGAHGKSDEGDSDQGKQVDELSGSHGERTGGISSRI